MGFYLKKLAVSLSISSLLFTYTVYLVQLFTLGDAYMGWLLVGVLISSTLLFSCTHPKSWIGQRGVKNTLFVVTSLVVGSGTFLAFNMDSFYSTILTIIGYLLLAGIILGIFQTTLAADLATNAKVLHVLNIALGVALTLGTLYFLYIFLLFSEDGNGGIWELFVPLVIYVILYFVQMKVLKAQRKGNAYTFAAIQFLVPAVLIWIWNAVAAGEGGF